MTSTPEGVRVGPSTGRSDGVQHLRDDTGTVLGWTVVDPDHEPVRAEPLVRSPGSDARHLARVAAVDLAGMRVATDDEELADALIQSGGTLVRRGTVMATHLRARVPAIAAPPEGSEIRSIDTLPTPPDSLAEPLTAPRRAAYHPQHPDHDPDVDPMATTATLRALLGGTVVGPLDPALSAVARTATSRAPVGAIIVTHMPEDALWPGGPWIADLFVHPTYAGQGLGRHLLQHTLSACGQMALPRLGLAVTHGNPATRLYRSAGFADVFRSWAIELPP